MIEYMRTHQRKLIITIGAKWKQHKKDKRTKNMEKLHEKKGSDLQEWASKVWDERNASTIEFVRNEAGETITGRKEVNEELIKP